MSGRNKAPFSPVFFPVFSPWLCCLQVLQWELGSSSQGIPAGLDLGWGIIWGSSSSIWGSQPQLRVLQDGWNGFIPCAGSETGLCSLFGMCPQPFAGCRVSVTAPEAVTEPCWPLPHLTASPCPWLCQQHQQVFPVPPRAATPGDREKQRVHPCLALFGCQFVTRSSHESLDSGKCWQCRCHARCARPGHRRSRKEQKVKGNFGEQGGC